MNKELREVFQRNQDKMEPIFKIMRDQAKETAKMINKANAGPNCPTFGDIEAFKNLPLPTYKSK